MNAVVPAQFGAVSARFAGTKIENDLGAGVQGGFGLIGYKGKVWSTRKGGEERQLMREDGDGPRNSIEVVILKAPTVVSKIFYEQGYVEGSTAPPDCYSTNGVTPAAGAVKKQSQACATCPKNAWGSRITPAGKQGKACSDSKRLAVVPMNDIPNEVLGGPMLLRVPAASLQDISSFGSKMAALGYPYYSIAVRIAFDAQEAYPKFVFSAIRPLTDAEADLVLKMRDGPEVARILAEEDFGPVPAQEPHKPNVDQVFEQPPQHPPATQQPAPRPAPTQTANTQAASAAQPASPPAAPMTAVAATAAPATQTVNQNVAAPSVSAPTGVEDFDAKLDALLGA